MTNVCLVNGQGAYSNRVGTYAPSSSGGFGGGGSGTWNITSTETSNVQIKNIDAVDVEANHISCTTLTVDGTNISTNTTSVANKTQNIDDATTTAGTTTFTGTVTIPTLSLTGDALSASTITTQNIYAKDSGDAKAIAIGTSTNKIVNIFNSLSSTNKVSRVGILTADPTATLDVAGTSKGQYLEAAPPSTITSSATVLKGIQSGSTTNTETRFLLGQAESTNNAACLSFTKPSTTSGDTASKVSLYPYSTSTPATRLDMTAASGSVFTNNVYTNKTFIGDSYQPYTSGAALNFLSSLSSGNLYKFYASSQVGASTLRFGKSDTSSNSLEITYDTGTTTSGETVNVTTASGSIGITGATNPGIYFKNTQTGIGTKTFAYAAALTASSIAETAPQLVIYRQTAAQSIASNTTGSVILFGTTDTTSGSIPLTNTSGVFKNTDTITRFFQVSYSVGFGANATNYRQIIMTATGTGSSPTNAIISRAAASSSGETWVNGSGIVKLVKDGTFYLTASQENTTAVALNLSLSSIIHIKAL
jgi:hypothetical protein